MQLCDDTKIYIVGDDGIGCVTIEGLANAIRGGLDLQAVNLFTDKDEANADSLIRRRRELINAFDDEAIRSGRTLVLLNEDGVEISKVVLPG